MAKMTGAELLRSLRAEADRVAALGAGLRDRIDTLADPTAAEAEVEAVRAAAEQRAAAAEARAAAAEQRAAQAEQYRAEADAAAEEMSEQLTAAQARAESAEERAPPPEADRDTAVAQARADADARVSRRPGRAGCRYRPGPRRRREAIRAAEADRDQAPQAAADAGTVAGQAQQETARAQAGEQAARAETGRIRADTERMLEQMRADAARERDELRADLRARAERAEQQADAYRAELDRLRAAATPDTGTSPAGGQHAAKPHCRDKQQRCSASPCCLSWRRPCSVSAAGASYVCELSQLADDL